MHGSVMDWATSKVEEYGLGEVDVLDLGSYDVNGCVRHLFNGNYTGCDMRAGPNVDVVCNAHDLVEEFGEGRFDAVICLEMLEHDSAFWVTMEQIGRVLKPGGRLLLTARGIHFGHHNPPDYWRFTEEAGREMLLLAGLTETDMDKDRPTSGIFVGAIKEVD